MSHRLKYSSVCLFGSHSSHCECHSFFSQSILDAVESVPNIALFFQSDLDSGSSPHLMSSDVLQYIFNLRCFISSLHLSLQFSIHILIILSVHHRDHSNLCYRRRRRLSLFDVYEDFSFIQQILQSLIIIIFRYLIYSLLVRCHRLLRL